jgi:hypothetical protein
MNRKNGGIGFALCLLAGRVSADSDAVTQCIADWTTSCSKDCATSQCVSDCTTQARAMCDVNVTAAQQAFRGPVTATPTDQCTPPPTPLACAPELVLGSPAPPANATCSVISGSVANNALWGGQVTIYVICPPLTPAGHENGVPTTTTIGNAQSSCADGSFTITASNVCAGQTGCYGLIAATPPESCDSCGTCAATPGDPGWSTCTSASCPSQ